MPDWFYRTAAQPVLFALPDPLARRLALGIIGPLGRSRAGRQVIQFMGHMAPDPRLRTVVDGTAYASPFGLGWRVDPERRASRGLREFGAGTLEVCDQDHASVIRGADHHLHEVPASIRLPVSSAPDPVLRRGRDEACTEHLILPSGRVLPVRPWDEAAPPADTDRPAAGVALQVGTKDPASRHWTVPAAMPPDLPAQVRSWREALGSERPLIVCGGVAQPADAVALMDAGASLVLIDAGLVFSGPGLVKRCNRALVARRLAAAGSAPGLPTGPIMRQSWFWALMLGLGLFAGGALALGLAFGRVLLPYDEQFLGLSAEALRLTSPRLHAFMAHDRATLAGVMLGLGWLYAVLARHAIKPGVHGARSAVVASALAGFASFGSFLGFGYFDTLHAFVAAILFQLTIQLMVGDSPTNPDLAAGGDEENADWRRAQWGQLFWVVHAVGLLLAGTVILGIGMTAVFVSEDLAFLCMTADQVRALGERVVSVVAHDRATLGGMLWASGIAMLLPVLWCFQRRATWLWWAMAGLGLPAYGATLGVHLWVGYTDWRHLLPAVLGLLLWLGGLIQTRRYLSP